MRGGRDCEKHENELARLDHGCNVRTSRGALNESDSDSSLYGAPNFVSISTPQSRRNFVGSSPPAKMNV